MKSKIVVIVLLIILLTACNTGQATVLPSSMMNVATEAVLSQTLTLQHTLTPRPTRTPAPTFPATQTIPASTLNAVATVEAIRMNLIDHFPELQEYQTFCTPYECYGVEVSPNGQLIYLTNFNTIDLFSVDGERVGKYSFYEIYGHFINFRDGYLEGIHWSKDGRYLYVATSFGDGGPEAYFRYRSSVARVNLENGTWKDTGVLGVLRFSPDDKYIVYSTNNGEIRIRNLQTGEEKVYFAPENYIYFGNFVWSSNSKKIVFVATSESWETDDSKFALLMIDIESQKFFNLYESSFPFYYPVDWVENDKVALNKFQQFGEWMLDLSVTPPIVSP